MPIAVGAHYDARIHFCQPRDENELVSQAETIAAKNRLHIVIEQVK